MTPDDDPLGGWGAYVDDSAEAERAQLEAQEQDARPGEYRNIWVYAEIREDHVRASTYELIGRARELADSLGVRVGAFLFGPDGIRTHSEALIKAGADNVYVAEDPLFARQDPDVTTAAIVRLVNDRRPELILLGQSTFGDAVAGRIAVALGTGAVARVKDLTVDTAERLFVFGQVGFQGRLERSSWIPKVKPQVATVLRRSFQRPLPDPTRSGRVVDVMPEIGPDLVRIRYQGDADDPPAPPLERADVVVLTGKGIGSVDGWQKAAGLGEVLHGAQMACTRSCVDLGFAPEDRMVGIHGITISPRLLITLGVSGDLDTLEGIDRSRLKRWIAVDHDQEANILEEAHVAVVGDWEAFVEGLIETLKGEKRALSFE